MPNFIKLANITMLGILISTNVWAAASCPNFTGKYIYNLKSPNVPDSCTTTKHFSTGPEIPTLTNSEEGYLVANDTFEIHQTSCDEMTFLTAAGEIKIPISNNFIFQRDTFTPKDSLATKFRTQWNSNQLVHEEYQKSKDSMDGITVRQKGNKQIIWAITSSGDLILDGTSWAYGLIGPMPVIERSTIKCNFKKAP